MSGWDYVQRVWFGFSSGRGRSTYKACNVCCEDTITMYAEIKTIDPIVEDKIILDLFFIKSILTPDASPHMLFGHAPNIVCPVPNRCTSTGVQLQCIWSVLKCAGTPRQLRGTPML